jgi:group I intron endonuclease
MNTYHYIYQITNKTNGHIYIGVRQSTVYPEDDIDYMGSGVHIRRAILKYGLANFEKTIISTHESRELSLAAEASIVTLEFVLRDDTYNLRLGGQGGSIKGTISEETRQKMSKSLKGKIISDDHKETLSKLLKGKPGRNTGKTHTTEARQKMSISNKGKSRSIQARQNMAEAAKRRPPMSDETRKKLSEAQRNRIRKPHSEDTKRKISQAMQGKSKELSATASN